MWAKRAISILGVKIEIEGKVPSTKAIFVSNHKSYIDPPIIMAATGCTMLSKSEVAKMPIIGAGARAVEILFVEREKRSSRIESLEIIADALERNVSVGIFPEGTTNAKEELLPFKAGVFNLAAKRDCPIIPMALTYIDPCHVWGDESMYTYYMRCFSKPVVEVKLKFGPVYRNENSRELRQAAFDWIQGNTSSFKKEEKNKFENVEV